MWLTGPAAPRHVGSSQTRARTRVPCIGRQTLNHCATREAQPPRFKAERWAVIVKQISDFRLGISWGFYLLTRFPSETWVQGVEGPQAAGRCSTHSLPSSLLASALLSWASEHGVGMSSGVCLPTPCAGWGEGSHGSFVGPSPQPGCSCVCPVRGELWD